MTVITKRDLTDFDKWPEHTHYAEEYCCPHCLESAPQNGVSTDPIEVTCPKCSKPFVAWQDQQPVYLSAF